jgi:hypothetical protein
MNENVFRANGTLHCSRSTLFHGHEKSFASSAGVVG